MSKKLRIGVLFSRVRVEEKWIFAALERRGLDYERLDDRLVHFDLDNPDPWRQYDAILERSISYNNGLYACRIFNSWGIPTVNTAAVAEACGDKLITSALLAKAKVPQPHSRVAFTPEVGPGSHRGHGLPGGAQAGGRFVGPPAGQGQRPRIRRGHPGTQSRARLGPALGLLHPGIYQEARAGYPRRRRRRPGHHRHLPQIGPLDHQHGPRRRGRTVPRHA